MKEQSNLDYSLYFNEKTWQLSEEQVQEIINKMLLHEKLKKIEDKNIKEKKVKL